MYSANMYSAAGVGQALCSGDTDANKSKDGEVLLHGVYTQEYTITAEKKAPKEGRWSLTVCGQGQPG